jgi:hypothetical protein
MDQLKYKVHYDVKPLNTETYNDSYYAYLLALESNQTQRKSLVEKIIKDPYVSYLFFINAVLTNTERDIIFNSILKDINSCYLTLKYNNLNDDERYELLLHVLEDYSTAYSAAKNCQLTNDELKLIYDKYHEQLFATYNIDTLIDNYGTFLHCVADNYKKKIVNIIVDKEYLVLAKSVLKMDQNLPEDLRDLLESLLLMFNLRS